jgi:hypothetical protein
LIDFEEEKTVWSFEAGTNEDRERFVNDEKPFIGISYIKNSPPYNRFSYDAKVGDLVWLVSRGDRPGRAGIIKSSCKRNPNHPTLRRKVEWVSSDLFLTKKPMVPYPLVRYSRAPVTGSFARMKNLIAIDEVRKLCGFEPLEKLYTDDDIIINFTHYLERRFPPDSRVEDEFVKPWLEEMGYRVEMAEDPNNPVWDMRAYKRGVGTFLVQVKHTSAIDKYKVQELVEEATEQGIGAWWIALGLIDMNTIHSLQQSSDILAIWGSRDIYETFVDYYNGYSRNFRKKIIPLRWALLPFEQENQE